MSEEQKQYKYYYSVKQHKHIKELANQGFMETTAIGTHRRMSGKINTIKGIPFTEMCDLDGNPTGNFDDYDLVYTGTMKGLKIKNH